MTRRPSKKRWQTDNSKVKGRYIFVDSTSLTPNVRILVLWDRLARRVVR